MRRIIWRPVYGFEGSYQVSNTGDVRSLNRVICLPDGSRRKIEGKLLSPKHHRDGYLFVALSNRDGIFTRYIHRLVAGAFIPNPWNLPEVNHLDGNKENNLPYNLAWCTHAQNVQHAYDNNLSCNKGGSHPFAVGIIDNELGRTFETVKDWCEARGINYSTGRNLLNGTNKSKTIDLSAIVKINKSNA